MSSPRIVIIQLKELLYTALFALLGVILIILLIYMFVPKNKGAAEPVSKYYPGIYTSTIMLNNQLVGVEVNVTKDDIKSISLNNYDPNMDLIYPLVQPTMANINKQLKKNKDIESVKPEAKAKETTKYILEAVQKALDKAEVK